MTKESLTWNTETSRIAEKILFRQTYSQWDELREGKVHMCVNQSSRALGNHCTLEGAMVVTEDQTPHFSFMSD